MSNPSSDEIFLEELQHTMLGRLQYKLFQRISGKVGVVPSPKAMRQFVLKTYETNIVYGRMVRYLLGLKECYLQEFDKLNTEIDIKKLLVQLEKKPLHEPFFLELHNCPANLSPILGTLIYSDPLADEGYVYTITFFSGDEFPDQIAGHLEIRANEIKPQPMFSLFKETGYEEYDLNNFEESSIVTLSLWILSYTTEQDLRPIRAVDFKDYSQINHKDSRLKPPHDSKCLENLQLVRLGLITCTEAQIDLSEIKPFSIDFCLSYPMDVIDKIAYQMKWAGWQPRLLVYWHNGSFIMSDDYGNYLAYRKLQYKEVPIIIMGEHPLNDVNVLRIGGEDLIPPLYVIKHDKGRNHSFDLKNWILDKQLRQKTPSRTVIELYALFITLIELLQNPRTDEKDIQQFLEKNPITLDPHGVEMFSEVRLENKYRIDLVIKYYFSNKQILLIELERSDHQIFTKTGRYRAKVTHAIQQVEDWLRWLREHPDKAPEIIDPSIPLSGMVIIGRTRDMKDEEKRILASLNETRKVQVITYDDLLEHIKELINNLEIDESD